MKGIYKPEKPVSGVSKYYASAKVHLPERFHLCLGHVDTANEPVLTAVHIIVRHRGTHAILVRSQITLLSPPRECSVTIVPVDITCSKIPV